jgi:cbb3-type cytochrome oxidase subunit 3
MMDWLAVNGSILVLVAFFALFLAFAFWAYAPANRRRMESHGHIPLKEAVDE